MTGIFKANNPSNNLSLFLYGLLLKLPVFIYPQPPHIQEPDGILYTSMLDILQPFAKGFPHLYSIILFLLLYIQALSFNKIVNAQRQHAKPNYLTGMAYLLITSLFSEWFALSAPLLVSTLLIWVWSKLCNLHNDPKAKSSIFDTGFITGVAAFFYFPSIAFVILIMVGLTIARPFRLAEWLLGLIGIATPFYFFGAWLFLSDKWKAYKFPQVHLSYPRFVESGWAYTAIVLVLITVFIGIFFIRDNLRRQVLQTRKSWQLLFLYLVVSVLVPFLNTQHSFTYWILVAVPVSVISASAFLYPDRKWFPVGMHWAMVAISLAIGYFIH